jgi:hypothetical protein
MKIEYSNFMNKKSENISGPVVKRSRFGLRKIMGVVALAIIFTVLLTAWWVKHNIYASKFTPTLLAIKEQ